MTYCPLIASALLLLTLGCTERATVVDDPKNPTIQLPPQAPNPSDLEVYRPPMWYECEGGDQPFELFDNFSATSHHVFQVNSTACSDGIAMYIFVDIPDDPNIFLRVGSSGCEYRPSWALPPSDFFSKSAEANASSIEANAQELLNDFTTRCGMAKKAFTDFQIYPPSTLAEMLSRAERQMKVNDEIMKREAAHRKK